MIKDSIKITAMFIGTSSLGYETGQTYELHLWTEDNISPWKKQQIIISGAEHPEKQHICRYDSIIKFFENWGLASAKTMHRLLTACRVMDSTDHKYVVFALEQILDKEKGFAKNPFSRLSAEKLTKEGGITAQDITESKERAEKSVKQIEYTIALLTDNKFVVGRDDLMEALEDYARKHFAERNAATFASDVIDYITKNK